MHYTRRQFLAHASVAGLLGWRRIHAQGPQPATIPGIEVGEVTESFALSNVTVIDGTGNPARPGMTVEIAGNRIQSIRATAATRLASDVRTVDASGKFLIPGLWDMHTHIDPNSFALFIPNGVTGIRLMGLQQIGMEAFSLRSEIAAGHRLGPRLVVPVRLVGDGLAGRGQSGSRLALVAGLVNTVDEAREGVRKAVESGADFVKVHTPMSRDIFFAIIDEAKRMKIRVAGHVPQPQVKFAEASNAGLASIEHVESVLTHVNNELRGPAGVAMDGLSTSQAAAMSDLFALFRRNGTWFCPTLTDTPRQVPILSTDSRLRYFDPTQRKIWVDNVIPRDRTETAKRNYRAMASFTAAMHKVSVGILAGSDVSVQFGMPGFWLHEELNQLVAAGLTPMDALRSATFKPAEFLGLTSTLGSVEIGKLSEMVLLDANPLDDITNTQKINSVFTGGRVYRRSALDAILSAVEANARN